MKIKDSVGKRVGRYLKHIIITFLVLGMAILLLGYFSGEYFKYDKNYAAYNIDRDGPYISEIDSSLWLVEYIRGNKEDGFSVDRTAWPKDQEYEMDCFYVLDSSTFTFKLQTNSAIPPSTYQDDEELFVVADIESNFNTFRKLLINNQVIDANLNWTFGKGHLVLNGDFIDRSYFTTQVLYLIMSLEQKALKSGGQVHYILGNHEIMNMQGDHRYAKGKYAKVATILGKKQHELYDTTSFIGRWLQSKNTMEMINGHLFVHAGINPKISKLNMDIDQMNQFIRKHYYKKYYARKGGPKREDLLLSSHSSPYWFRGYFKKEMSQDDIQKGLDIFGAKDVVVGHTVQKEVQRLYQGKVIGVDVDHPQDYYKYFPSIESQGLLIQGDHYFRVHENGEKEEI